MNQRCNNPKNPAWANYGGRGIKVCSRWESFEQFEIDMGERPSGDFSLDRIDNDGDYEPGNCRWATMKTQANNRRPRDAKMMLTHEGVTKTIQQWADHLGIAAGTIHQRRWKRWPIEKVLSQNLRVS
jgi:hypothetical protein